MEIISSAKRESDLADAIVMRAHEVYAYDINIENYEAYLIDNPEQVWPDRLLPLRDLPAQEAAAKADHDDVELLSLCFSRPKKQSEPRRRRFTKSLMQN
jgi:hypothetical protein